jgi:hypothetical protein
MKYCKNLDLKSTFFINSIIDITVHLLLTAIISLVIYLKSRNFSYIAFFAAGGILIDVDHFLDHFLYYRFKFNIRDFISCNSLASGKAYVLLHSWEINLLVFLAGLWFDSPHLLFLALGLTIHLGVDNLQQKNLWCYSLVYRILKKFEIRTLFPDLYGLKERQVYDH